MKWIGQHIWDFISRFRSDVYLESVDSGTIASGGNLGLDSNNKIVKSASPSGSIDLTSEVTGTLPVANGGTGATSLTDNSILTGTGTSPITAEANFTYSGTAMSLNAVTSTFTNATTSTIIIENTGSNSAAGVLKLTNTKAGGNGDVSDIGGTIQFVAKNDGGAVVQIGEVRAIVTDPAAATHSSSLQFFLANEGVLCSSDHPGIIIEGNTGTADVINTTLSHGATSITTVAGDLDIDGDAITAAGNLTITPGGTLELDSTGNMTLDSSADIEINADSGLLYFKDASASLAKIGGSDGLAIYKMGNSNSLVTFETATENVVLQAPADSSAERTVTLPDATGTLQVVDTVKYLLPSDFIVNDAAFVRGYLYAADDAGSDYGGTWQDAGLESWAWYQIPKGFKVTHMHAYGNTTSNTDASIYQLNPTDGTRGSALATGTWNTNRSLSSAITSSDTSVVLVTLNPNASTDIIYSVKLTLALV